MNTQFRRATGKSDRLSRSRALAIVLTASVPVLGALFAATSQAAAQTTGAAATDVNYLAVVTGSDVYVRCGAAESYYPFAKVNKNDLVKVTGEKFGWARIATVGPAFTTSFGYIKYAKGDASKVRLASNGKSALTLGKTDIVAPNLDARNNPRDSWKALVRLDADQNVAILETTETDKEIVHKVSLPENGHGWVSAQFLTRASDAQVGQWKQWMNSPLSTNATPASTSTNSTSTPNPGSSSSNSKFDTFDNSWDAPQFSNTTTPTASNTTVRPVENTTSTVTAAPPTTPRPAFKSTFRGSSSLEELEAAYKLLQNEPLETAEVGQLRALYLSLAKTNPSDKRVQRYANLRAEQLEIWGELQRKRQELEHIKTRMKMSAREAEAVRLALERSAEYVGVGRIASSTIYDGQSLPKLLRLQDASTGRTVAYLQPDDKYELVNLLDTIVGIVGEKTYDEGLRLHLIQPTRIDVLAPRGSDAATATAAPPVEWPTISPDLPPLPAPAPQPVVIDPDK